MTLPESLNDEDVGDDLVCRHIILERRRIFPGNGATEEEVLIYSDIYEGKRSFSFLLLANPY